MSNVKPKMGQVWENNGNEYTAKQALDGFVNMWAPQISAKLGIKIDDGFYSVFKFIPQNDLEWLAVNEPVWKADHFVVIRKDSDWGTMYHRALNSSLEWYIRQQWQDKRYELGLDTEPKSKTYTGDALYPLKHYSFPCVLTPIKKETKMIDLSNAKVGDKFVARNDTIVSFLARTKMNSICESNTGRAIVYHHNGQLDESVGAGINNYGWDIKSKHEPRHWLKDLPDADLFSDDVNWIAFDNNQSWWAYPSEPELLIRDFEGKGQQQIKAIKMPTLSGDDWKLSKISIADLKAWQGANK